MESKQTKTAALTAAIETTPIGKTVPIYESRGLRFLVASDLAEMEDRMFGL